MIKAHIELEQTWDSIEQAVKYFEELAKEINFYAPQNLSDLYLDIQINPANDSEKNIIFTNL